MRGQGIIDEGTTEIIPGKSPGMVVSVKVTPYHGQTSRESKYITNTIRKGIR